MHRRLLNTVQESDENTQRLPGNKTQTRQDVSDRASNVELYRHFAATDAGCLRNSY